jgi:dihydrofolate synthase/folylpolyglutamate synthase
MFSRTGNAALKMDLSNTLHICKTLGNPEQQLKTIHVAGTNGKGSVSHLIASILQENGYRTGLYTSPHLYDFRERIKINGKMIPKETVIHFTEKMKPLIEAIEPSFFELTVGMAFEHFSSEKVDYAVIETGMGGRLDSTNVINPLISIITNIGFDHMSILGNTLEKIASEKAGIIKANVPVVIGKKDMATAPVFERFSNHMNAPMLFAEDCFQTRVDSMEDGLITIETTEKSASNTKRLTTPLSGIYQTENTGTVITAVKKMRELGIDIGEEAVLNGFLNVIKNTGLHGRWEFISKNPAVILDVAHNPAGIQKLCEQISITPHKQLHIILGMSNDKDVKGILELLPVHANYGFTKADLPRAMNSHELAEAARSKGLKGECYPNVNEALHEIRRNAAEEDMIIVCGSIFVVGEVDRSQFS